MKALVLGGSVFVGRRLVAMLAAGGDDVTVLNRGRTPAALPAGVAHLVADRTDPESMAAALAGTQWDVVFDVSGFVMAAGGSDIAGLLDLLDGRVGSYVFVSSVMAYDQSLAGVFPWHEGLPTNPEGPSTYGGFKALAEAQMLERHAATGFPVTIVRPAAIYGPENNIYDMETPMFLRLLRGRPILVPHEGLVATSYGHVDDLCAAMLELAGLPAARGRVFNISGDAVTSLRYVTDLAAIVGRPADVVLVPPADLALAGKVFGHLFSARHHAVLDISAVAALGVAPSEGFVDGHRSTFEWFLAQGWDRLTEPLVDPTWRATWDFDAEDALVASLRGRT